MNEDWFVLIIFDLKGVCFARDQKKLELACGVDC